MHNDRPEQVEFFGRKFSVNSHVLMPRLETESLVRRAKQELVRIPADVVFDIGTWSGIIAVSLAGMFPLAQHIAVDISDEALSVARSNAQTNQVNIEFLKSDLLTDIRERDFSWKYLFFAANLPYIRIDDPEVGQDVAQFDPHLALYGWAVTGFECIEQFLAQALEYFSSAQSIRIMLEFGHDQTSIAQSTAEQYGYQFESFRDLSGIARFALLTYARPY